MRRLFSSFGEPEDQEVTTHVTIFHFREHRPELAPLLFSVSHMGDKIIHAFVQYLLIRALCWALL